jgi:hypothetical protein
MTDDAAGDSWSKGKIIMRAGNITCAPDKNHQRLKQMKTSDVNDGAPLWDRNTSTIWLPYVHGAVCGVGHGDSVMIISSGDRGESWSTPRNLTSSLPDIYAIGPGHGVQVHTGKYTGRLVFCGYGFGFPSIRKHNRTTTNAVICATSDTHGKTWVQGAPLRALTAFGEIPVGEPLGAEPQPVVLSNGSVLVEARGGLSPTFAQSDTGGSSWAAAWSYVPYKTGFIIDDCQGNLLDLGNDHLLFSGPWYTGPSCTKHPSPNVTRRCPPTRVNMTISESWNAGRDWSVLLGGIDTGSGGYSCMADLSVGTAAAGTNSIGLMCMKMGTQKSPAYTNGSMGSGTAYVRIKIRSGGAKSDDDHAATMLTTMRRTLVFPRGYLGYDCYKPPSLLQIQDSNNKFGTSTGTSYSANSALERRAADSFKSDDTAAHGRAAYASPPAGFDGPPPPSGFVQDRFAIGTFLNPAPSDAGYSLLAAANFTMILGTGGQNASGAAAQLRLCAAHGLKCTLNIGDYATSKGEKAGWKIDKPLPPTSPSNWGFYLKDEPYAGEFRGLAATVAQVRARDPAALSFVNLYPSNVSHAVEWGAPNYTSYVQQFVDTVRPDVLCFDHYPTFGRTVADARAADTREDYVANLAMVAEIAERGQRPMWLYFNIVPYGGNVTRMPHEGHEDPTEAQVRWQVTTALAYGARGLLYFLFRPLGGPMGGHPGLVRCQEGKAGCSDPLQPSHHYYQAQRINSFVLALAPVLMRAARLGTAALLYDRDRDPTRALARTPGFAGGGCGLVNISRGDWTVSCFRLDGGPAAERSQRAVLVANFEHAYTQYASVGWAGGAAVQEVDRLSGRAVPVVDDAPDAVGFQLYFDAGDARLFTIDDAMNTLKTDDDANSVQLWVDCGRGRDGNSGLGRREPLATLHEAQRRVRVARRSNKAARATVTVLPGTCFLHATRRALLELTTLDERVEWRGEGGGATLSSGGVLRNWTDVSWPGAPTGAVVRTSIAGWPIDVQTLRLHLRAGGPMNATVPRSRFPPRQPGNYSAGWLTTADWTPIATAKWYGKEPRPTQVVGLRPSDFPSAGVYHSHPTDLYVNIFQSSGEKDVCNQISRVSALLNGSGGAPAVACPLDGAEPGVRFFLENVRAALSPGHFYVDHARAEIFVWREAHWPPACSFEAVAPRAYEAVTLNGTRAVAFRNLTFADTSWATWGGNGDEDGPGGGPEDATIRVNQSSDIEVESCSFGPSISGYAVVIGNASTLVNVSRNIISGVGQGGVLLFGKGILTPHQNTIEYNKIQNIGSILKHVGGVMMKPAWDTYVGHNYIGHSPRYGIEFSSFSVTSNCRTASDMHSRVCLNNTIEHNVIDATCLETDDCGAVYAYTQGEWPGLASAQVQWNLGNKLLFNNISNVVDAAATDGVHVCVHGHSPVPGLGCRNLSWGIYLDGGGYHGLVAHGNVIDATVQGGFFANGAGNVNFTNNIVLSGAHSQLLYTCFSGPTRPGNRFLRNIFYFTQRGDDGLTPPANLSQPRARRSGPSWAERLIETRCLNASIPGLGLNASCECASCECDEAKGFDPSRFVEVDYNLYYNPALDLRTATWLLLALGDTVILRCH